MLFRSLRNINAKKKEILNHKQKEKFKINSSPLLALHKLKKVVMRKKEKYVNLPRFLGSSIWTHRFLHHVIFR